MKVTYEMSFGAPNGTPPILRGAALLRALADALETEAKGGQCVSNVGYGVQTKDTGDVLICKGVDHEQAE